jgi:F-type H+-transporting ATPase subunit a
MEPITNAGEQAALENKAPELPNFIQMLYHKFHEEPWAEFLYNWENLVFAIIIAILLSLVLSRAIKYRRLIPCRLQNAAEMLVEGLESLVTGVLGPEQGRKYFPFLATLFVYILSMNLFGMVPLMKSPSSNINVTGALAICVFVLVQFLNIRNMGVLGFLYHLAGSPKNAMEWILAPMMFPLELLTQLTRPVTLAIRLFGNVLGEDILVGAFSIFGLGVLASYSLPVGVPLQIPFMFLAVLTSTMQALVFTLLTTVYILLSMPHSDEKHS